MKSKSIFEIYFSGSYTAILVALTACGDNNSRYRWRNNSSSRGTQWKNFTCRKHLYGKTV